MDNVYVLMMDSPKYWGFLAIYRSLDAAKNRVEELLAKPPLPGIKVWPHKRPKGPIEWNEHPDMGIWLYGDYIIQTCPIAED